MINHYLVSNAVILVIRKLIEALNQNTSSKYMKCPPKVSVYLRKEFDTILKSSLSGLLLCKLGHRSMEAVLDLAGLE